MLTNNTTYQVANHTRRVFRLTPSFVWFRETVDGLTLERTMPVKLFVKWLRGVRRS